MVTTDNYKLAQLELTSSANFPVLLNNTFKTIDKGLTLDVGTSTGTGNDYVLNLYINLHFLALTFLQCLVND